MTMVCSWQGEGRIVKVLAMDEAEAETETDERGRGMPSSRIAGVKTTWRRHSTLHFALFFPVCVFVEKENPRVEQLAKLQVVRVHVGRWFQAAGKTDWESRRPKFARPPGSRINSHILIHIQSANQPPARRVRHSHDRSHSHEGIHIS